MAVVLAGGTSSRLGRPKQLLDLGGRPVLQHIVDAAREAGLDEIVVVLGHRAEEVAAALRLPPGARTVVNPGYAGGQSTSLLAGLEAAGPEIGAALVLLGDQPRVRPEAIRAVAEEYRRTGGPVAQASYRGLRGHPVLLDRRVWGELAALEGDVGARGLLARHPGWVVPVEVGGDPPEDLDTWEDYGRLGGRAAGSPVEEDAMEELYTHGVWIVRAGQEEAFVAAWRDLADWSVAAFPNARGTLLQDVEEPRRFHSFGSWESLEQLQAWRSSPGFQERVARIRELLERFEPRTMRLILSAGREA